MATLGEELRRLRVARDMKLRQVEEQSGISNGYLTQLENNKIKGPSPNILHKLSQVYEVPYSQLLKAAGYIVPAPEKKARRNSTKPDNPRGLSSYALSAAKLSPEEEEALIDYLRYLRFTKRGKK